MTRHRAQRTFALAALAVGIALTSGGCNKTTPQPEITLPVESASTSAPVSPTPNYSAPVESPSMSTPTESTP